MKDSAIIDLLKRTGHLEYPFGKAQFIQDASEKLSLTDRPIERAIASYQDFMSQHLDTLCMEHHGRPLRDIGEFGPATQQLMEQPRCGCCDYGDDVQPAVGKGSWKRCHDIGEFHAATVRVDKSGMPSFLKSDFETVWERCAAAYAELGLRWIRTDDTDANITFSFVSRSSGWIGLAVVGRTQSCGSEIWCKYLAKYHPGNVVREWTTLVMHELGHNAGLQHTRGGVMSPSIINGLAASWKGDPSESVLNRYYGGEPIPGGPDIGEFWVRQCFTSNRGREVCVPLIPPIPVDED